MRALLVAELPRTLQAAEGRLEAPVDRAAVVAHNVEERISGDRSVAGIEDRRANEPDRASVRAVRGQAAFGAAGRGRLGLQKSVGLVLAEAELRRRPRHALDKVQLVPAMEDRGPVQAESVLLAGGGQYRLTGRGRRGLVRPAAHRELAPPEVSDDPAARQVVAEVAEYGIGGDHLLGILRDPASVEAVAIAAEPPVVSEGRGGHAGHVKTGRETVAHAAARRGSENAVHALLRRDVSLEGTDDVLQHKAARVDVVVEEVLVEHERDG